MRIGIIGTGNIGGTLARLWVEAGHSVIVSSRHPEKLSELVLEIGAHATPATVEEAADTGDVILLALPLGGIPEVAEKIRQRIIGKVVLDAMNPFAQRDGQIAIDIKQRGIASAIATQERLPGAKVVRAFSSVNYRDLQTFAHRISDPVAVPFAGDDVEAKQIAAQLIRDAGFDPYDLGRLSDSQPQDPGGMLFGKALTRERIDQKLERVGAATR